LSVTEVVKNDLAVPEPIAQVAESLINDPILARSVVVDSSQVDIKQPNTDSITHENLKESEAK
jgi:hypothetical protein